MDIDENKINSINKCISPVYEDGIEDILSKYNITATTDLAQSVQDSEISFICVGTPPNPDGSQDMGYIKSAAKDLSNALHSTVTRNYVPLDIGKNMPYGHTVVVKSTVVPGTTENIVIPALEEHGKKAGKDFGVCMNPEFLKEGTAVADFMNPDRIVIGEYNKESGDVLAELYKDFKCPILRTDLKTAEMIKYASNAFLATKISFMNEIGNICKALGIDVYDVARGMGYDGRIGNKFLNAGIGFGGSCFPKDVNALVAKSKDIGYEPEILEHVLKLNDEQPLRIVSLLKKHIPTLKGSTVGVLGLSFKPDTDDIRESRAIPIVNALLKEGASIKAYDPKAMDNFRKLFPQVGYVAPEDVLSSDAVLILTEWKEFDELDYKGKTVIDGRRIIRAKKEADVYEGICW